MLEKFIESNRKKREQKKQDLRLKNAKMRARGEEPLKGWGMMVNTGSGGLNKGGIAANSIVDITGRNLENANAFDLEYKKTLADIKENKSVDE